MGYRRNCRVSSGRGLRMRLLSGQAGDCRNLDKAGRDGGWARGHFYTESDWTESGRTESGWTESGWIGLDRLDWKGVGWIICGRHGVMPTSLPRRRRDGAACPKL